jgi:L-cystine transport system permease protein
MVFDFNFVKEAFPIILMAVPMTLFLAVTSMLIGLVIGLIIALIRIYKVPVLRRIAEIYVSFIRGTPLVVQIYLAYYALPYEIVKIANDWGAGWTEKSLPSTLYAIVAFSLNASGYLSEAIRSALESVDAGQMEAAYSIGMTRMQGMIRIVIPQALIVALPNFGNLFLGLIKGTSIAFMISVREIMAVSVIEASVGYDFVETYLMAAIIYLAICFIFERLFKVIESNLKAHRAEITA